VIVDVALIAAPPEVVASWKVPEPPLTTT